MKKAFQSKPSLTVLDVEVGELAFGKRYTLCSESDVE